MKSSMEEQGDAEALVAPYAGAWIEIETGSPSLSYPMNVAPYAGAWIEISTLDTLSNGVMSLPTRERGLKS